MRYMAYERLRSDLQKLYGLAPYNTPSNICYGDGYFAKSIESRYSKEKINEMKKELGIK
jgi:hypothetical protein